MALVSKFLPDFYNTGCNDSPKRILNSGTVTSGFFNDSESEFKFKIGSSHNLIIDCAYSSSNKALITGKDYVIEGVDFVRSIATDDNITNDTLTIESINPTSFNAGHLIFRNCIFGNIKLTSDVYREDDPWVVIEDCDILGNTKTYNVKYTKVRVGGERNPDYGMDGMYLYGNMIVEDSFFHYKWKDIDDGGRGNHIDGMQLTGNASHPNYHIRVSNCRFEMPSTNALGNPYEPTNSCMILQSENGATSDVVMTDIIANGGFYTMFINPSSDNMFTNFSLTGFKIGNSNRYGDLYKNQIPSGVTYEREFINVAYATSITKQNGVNYLVCSNDSATPQDITIKYGSETINQTLPKMIGKTEIEAADVNTYTYDNLPIDVLVGISGEPSLISFENNGQTTYFIKETDGTYTRKVGTYDGDEEPTTSDNVLIKESTMIAIADAIRGNHKTTNKYLPADMPSAIRIDLDTEINEQNLLISQIMNALVGKGSN